MRSLSAFAAVLVVALASSAAARAHGGPATDVLERDWVFFPLSASAPRNEVDRLRTVVDAARAENYPIKVALIRMPSDLGVDFTLWRKPQKYARFLGLELQYVYKGPVLIVMPNGYGLFHYRKPTPEVDALNRLTVTQGTTGLTRSAVEAVAALARATGHPVAVPPVTGSSSGFSDRLVIIVVASVLAAAFAGLEVRRRRTT